MIRFAADFWAILGDMAPYLILGFVIAGILSVMISQETVEKQIGDRGVSSVVKASLFGIPLPLCSCGVLPAAAALKKQGANNGATAAFLISTPESGVDSIAVTYALLDPIMTVARPLAAFVTALAAGFTENLLRPPKPGLAMADFSCVVDGCCSGIDCPPETHAAHHSFGEKLLSGMRYAIGELWGDLAGWFLFGLLLAGGISALVPETLITGYLSGGLGSMLLMLAFGIPLYICATASTPIAAALILKGVSPGAALVFLLAGPATNMATLTVLANLLGRRTTLVYLTAIAVGALLCGLAVDWVYALLGIQAQAVVGQAAEIMPYPVQLGSTLLLLALSVRPISAMVRGWLKKGKGGSGGGCGCEGSCEIK